MSQKKKCEVCGKKATTVVSLEWVSYPLRNGEVEGNGTVTDIEQEKFYCDKHAKFG